MARKQVGGREQIEGKKSEVTEDEWALKKWRDDIWWFKTLRWNKMRWWWDDTIYNIYIYIYIYTLWLWYYYHVITKSINVYSVALYFGAQTVVPVDSFLSSAGRAQTLVPVVRAAEVCEIARPNLASGQPMLIQMQHLKNKTNYPQFNSCCFVSYQI